MWQGPHLTDIEWALIKCLFVLYFTSSNKVCAWPGASDRRNTVLLVAAWMILEMHYMVNYSPVSMIQAFR